MSRLLRRFVALLSPGLFLLAFSSVAAAQIGPRVQVFGNFSELRLDTKPLGFADWSGLEGANAGFDFNIWPRFGVVGEIGGDLGGPWKFYDAMAGPRYSREWKKLTFFGQGLVGKAKMHVALPGEINGGESDSGLAYGGGGGVDYHWKPRLWVRAIQVDYLHSNLLQADQKNIRFSVGITYNFGQIGRRRHRLP